MCSCAIKKLDEKIYDLVLFIMFEKVSENPARCHIFTQFLMKLS